MAGVGDRRDKPLQSHLQVDCLNDIGIRTRIRILHDLVNSCRGPHGKAKVIQNSVGGHVTWTKTSSRLFSIMSVSTPVLKLMISCFQGHIGKFQDGGLLTSALCLSLVNGSLELDLHKRLLVELYEEFVLIIDKYLMSKDCECKFKVDVFSINQVMNVLRSMCEPKLSYLSCKKIEKICCLFLDVFLSTIPFHKQEFFSNRVFIQCFENSDMLDSVCLKGLLIECPELSSLEERKLEIEKTSDPNGAQRIKVALLTESMSGDTASVLDAVYEIKGKVNFNAVVVENLLEFCQNLIQAGVKLLLCQRVIHPKVKAMFRQADVMFVDRLGSQVIPFIRDLTGATPVSILSPCPKKDWNGFGWVDSISHQIWSSRSYLLLKYEDQPVVTLVLKSNIEEHLQELKTLSQSAVTSLNLLLQDPWVLSGGGCWMSHTAVHLSQQVHENMTRLVEDLDCNRSQVLQASETFIRCLMALATSTTSNYNMHGTDSLHHHIWKSADESHMTSDESKFSSDETTCNCGIVQSDSVDKFEFVSEKIDPIVRRQNVGFKGFPKVVDSLPMVRNALKMAVATANTVLGISQFIHDPA